MAPHFSDVAFYGCVVPTYVGGYMSWPGRRRCELRVPLAGHFRARRKRRNRAIGRRKYTFALSFCRLYSRTVRLPKRSPSDVGSQLIGAIHYSFPVLFGSLVKSCSVSGLRVLDLGFSRGRQTDQSCNRVSCPTTGSSADLSGCVGSLAMAVSVVVPLIHKRDDRVEATRGRQFSAADYCFIN